MNPLVVVPDGMDPARFGELRATGGLDVHPENGTTPEALGALLPRAAGLVVRSRTRVGAGLLERAPGLRLVVRAGEGTDTIDTAACAARGVRVANTPGANSNAAAEHAVALLLAVLRRLAAAHRSVLEGRWDRAAFPGTELAGKTVGVVGFGKTGSLAARRLAGFETDRKSVV